MSCAFQLTMAKHRISRMLHWSMVFLILAIATGFMGFAGITSNFAGFAQLMFVVFLALLLISLVAELVGQTDL